MLLALLAATLATLIVVAASSLPDVRSLARRNPRHTAMMRERQAEARARGRAYHVDQRWIPYGRISPLLRRAVLIAEDDAFFSHGGLDWKEIRASARTNWEAGRIVRGGSTITQQLAKNLYLGSARTPQRKVEEVLIALHMERTLSKRRIFELYLNVIEWGDGVFGAEAAAQRYFGVSAADLDARQALLLAAVIVNPRRFSVLDPPPRTEARVRTVAGRMLRRGFLSDGEYRAALGEPPETAPWWKFWAPSPVPPESVTVEPEPMDSLEVPWPEEAPVDTLLPGG